MRIGLLDIYLILARVLTGSLPPNSQTFQMRAGSSLDFAAGSLIIVSRMFSGFTMTAAVEKATK